MLLSGNYYHLCWFRFLFTLELFIWFIKFTVTLTYLLIPIVVLYRPTGRIDWAALHAGRAAYEAKKWGGKIWLNILHRCRCSVHLHPPIIPLCTVCANTTNAGGQPPCPQHCNIIVFHYHPARFTYIFDSVINLVLPISSKIYYTCISLCECSFK